jgi:DNA-binding response OmpR family regulator
MRAMFRSDAPSARPLPAPSRDLAVLRTPARGKSTPVTGKVLCVDDDVDLTDLLQFALTRAGFTVVTANNGAQAEAAVKLDPPDLILLDINLPDIQGLELCARFRTLWQIPVVLVTALPGEEYEIAAFEGGADGYITKPFTMQVLVQRVQAVFRSTRASAEQRGAARSMYRLGHALFNASFNELLGNGVSCKLTPSEGKILHLLLTCEGQILTADRIMARVMPFDTESSPNVVKTHIRNLRVKIAKVLGEVEIIHTVPGSGYTLKLPPAEAQNAKQA